MGPVSLPFPSPTSFPGSLFTFGENRFWIHEVISPFVFSRIRTLRLMLEKSKPFCKICPCVRLPDVWWESKKLQHPQNSLDVIPRKAWPFCGTCFNVLSTWHHGDVRRSSAQRAWGSGPFSQVRRSHLLTSSRLQIESPLSLLK